jgi:hypothetical protein
VPNIGGHSDTLRVIGHFLDEQGGRYATIIEHETFMAVSWQTGRGEERSRSYSEFDIDDLRDRAHRMRGTWSGPPLGVRAEVMRTLGQDLDVLGVRLNSISEHDDGYQVTGTQNRVYFNRLFTNEELQRESEERRGQRSAATDPGTAKSGAPAAGPVGPDESRTPWWRRAMGKS